MVEGIRAAVAGVDPEQTLLLISGFAYRDFYALDFGARVSFRSEVFPGPFGKSRTWLLLFDGPEIEIEITVSTDERLAGDRWRLVKR